MKLTLPTITLTIIKTIHIKWYVEYWFRVKARFIDTKRNAECCCTSKNFNTNGISFLIQDPGYHNHNIQNQYQTTVFPKSSMDHGIGQANKNVNHPSKGYQNQQHCCHADRKLVEIDGLSTQCRPRTDVSLVHVEENETSSDEDKILPQTVHIDSSGSRLVNKVSNGFVNTRISSGRFSRNNSTSNKIGIAAKFCRPRPKSMDAEVLKNLERNCHNLMLESKKDKNRSLSDNEDTSSDGEDTTLDESTDLFQEKDIDQLMAEQRLISGTKCDV